MELLFFFPEINSSKDSYCFPSRVVFKYCFLFSITTSISLLSSDLTLCYNRLLQFGVFFVVVVVVLLEFVAMQGVKE